MAEKTDSKPVQCRFKSDQGYMVTTSGGVPAKRGKGMSTGLPVGNKGTKKPKKKK